MTAMKLYFNFGCNRFESEETINHTTTIANNKKLIFPLNLIIRLAGVLELALFGIEYSK
jgi:hypothetical protein